MIAIKSLIRRKGRNLISPRLALAFAYLFDIFLISTYPTRQGWLSLNETDTGRILLLAVVIAGGSQIVCTIRACFAKPKTLLKKAVFVIAIIPMLLSALIKMHNVKELIYHWIF